MKTKFYFLIMALVAMITPSLAQTGLEGFNYQTIVRDLNGAPVANTAVNFRFTITNQNNTVEYQETQLITTNSMGLANHVVGKGTSVQGAFANIGFQNADQVLEVEADMSGGNNFQTVGNMVLRSVPYALFAASGNSGPQGPAGPQGADGAIGPMGPQGPIGPQGIQGPAGTDGQNGTDGLSITAANIDNNGDLMLTLSDNSTVNAGSAIGPQGPAGTDGLQGPIGPQGIQGPAGTDGQNGTDGLSITAATIDNNGDLMLTLSDNSTVNAGSAIGPQGADGATGPMGPQGADGPIGPQGIQGPAGTDGQNGTDGLSITAATIDNNGDLMLTLSDNSTVNAGSAIGPQGADGATGPMGPQGADGPIGPQGIQGPAGTDGQNGTDGLSITAATIDNNGDLILTLSDNSTVNAGSAIGPQGPAGTDGLQGPAGTDGQNGADGISVASALIDNNGDLVFTLSDNNTLNVGSPINGAVASGDLSGSFPNPTVIKLQGIDVGNTVPLTNQVLKFDGTAWSPAADEGIVLPYSGTFSGVAPAFDLTQSGAGVGLRVSAQTGNAISALSDGGTAGNFIINNVANPSNTLNTITAGAGNAIYAESTSGSAISVSSQTGNGVEINVNDLANTSDAVKAINLGQGRAIYARSEDNFVAQFEISNAANNSHALVVTTAGGGSALLAKSENGVTAKIQNNNALNPNNTFEVFTNGASYAAYLNSTNNTDAKGLLIETANGSGGNALNLYNGTLAISAEDNYTGATIDDGVLIVTSVSSLALPTTIGSNGVMDGMTVWVINNTGNPLTITNGFGGAIVISTDSAKQFLFNTLVSANNWIGVD